MGFDESDTRVPLEPLASPQTVYWPTFAVSSSPSPALVPRAPSPARGEGSGSMEGSESNRLTLSLVGEGGPQPALSPAGAGRVRGREYVAEFMKRRNWLREPNIVLHDLKT